MWIKCQNEATQSLYNEDVLGDIVDDPVDDLPGDVYGVELDGPVQVASKVGEAMCEYYDSIQPYEADENES